MGAVVPAGIAAVGGGAALAPLVIAADTTVVIDGAVLEKPRDVAEAAAFVARLAAVHEVHTGHALRLGDREVAEVRTTRVRVRPLDADEVLAYAATGEGLDKAGGYAIQGRGAALIEGIEGCYGTVVGLSLPWLVVAARRLGVRLASFVRAWYVFLGLALLTFALTAFVGRVPASLSAAVALPNAALYRAGVHLRETVASMLERSAFRAEIEALQRDRVALEEANRRLELQVEGLERLLEARRAPVAGRGRERARDRAQLRRGRRHPDPRRRRGGGGGAAECRSPATPAWWAWSPRSRGARRSCGRCSIPAPASASRCAAKGGRASRSATPAALLASTASSPKGGWTSATSSKRAPSAVSSRAVCGSASWSRCCRRTRTGFGARCLVAPAVDLATTLDVVLIAPP